MTNAKVFLPQDVIRLKRDNQPLDADLIQKFVDGIVDGSVSDPQIAALGMAIFFNGMSPEEGASLTLSMRDSGEVMDWTKRGFDADAPIVDKHSTGGVGDKVSFMLAAIVAACGAYVPMIAGRGLGHTGGTVDKLEAITGYDVMLDNQKFEQVVKSVGCSIIGQTANLAPADKRFYAVRDVTATVESIPLITASILSKKLAAGLHSLVMDVKFGSGAFMDTMDKAVALGQNIVRVARAAGTPTSALLTDMNEVLGKTAGNAVEIMETIEFLNDPAKADKRLLDVTLDLAAEMLWRAGIAASVEEGRKKAQEAHTSGQAAEKFAQMITAHGGPADLMQNPEKHLTLAPVCKPVYADQAGYVQKMDTRQIGQTIVAMGGGRSVPGQAIDHSVGMTGFSAIGDYVDGDKPLCFIYAVNEDQWDMAAAAMKQSMTVGEDAVDTQPITARIIRD